MTKETICIKLKEGLRDNKKAKKVIITVLEQIREIFKEKGIEIQLEFYEAQKDQIIFTAEYKFDDFEKTNKPTFAAYLRNFKNNAKGKLKKILDEIIEEIKLVN